MKKLTAIVIALILTLSLCSAFADTITIGVPDDTTNEARALLLLAANGVIKLDENAGITATVADIIDNPLNIEFYEVEAANVPNVRIDVDYAIINNNYALDAGFSPAKDSLLMENAESPYVNVLTVKEGNENTDAAKALSAALSSKAVADFITTTWADGSVVCVIENVDEDGYDDTVNYDALAGTTISVGASPTPHAQVLAIAKDILAAKNITLEIIEFADYVQPNLVVDAGEVFANYFAHIPYQENFNQENGTHLVNILGVHVEPMALYGGKQADLTALGINK